MDWNNAKIVGSESNKHKRCIKEATEIRKRAQHTINHHHQGREKGNDMQPDTEQVAHCRGGGDLQWALVTYWLEKFKEMQGQNGSNEDCNGVISAPWTAP